MIELAQVPSASRAVIFVVPARNEERNIPKLVQGMREAMQRLGLAFRILIVDDASRDRTRAVAAECAGDLPLEVVRNEAPRGVGEVFRLGFRRALEIAGESDIIVTKEADNTSDLSILDAMLSKVEEGCDVVLASCFAPEGRVVGSTWDRHLLSASANALLRSFCPISGVHTYSSFYRAFAVQTLRRAFAAYEGRLLECDGFACMVEMLMKLSRLPIRIAEVPMVLQCRLREGSSKMVRHKTIQEYLQLILRQSLRSRLWDQKVRERFIASARSAAEPLAAVGTGN